MVCCFFIAPPLELTAAGWWWYKKADLQKAAPPGIRNLSGNMDFTGAIAELDSEEKSTHWLQSL